MRLTLVADNATSPNWGCRATSFALRELLSRDHVIAGTITRALLSGPLTYESRLPADLHRKIVRRFRRPKVRRVPMLGPLAFRAIDAAGRYAAPTHDIDGDADLLWRTRSSSPKSRAIVEAVTASDAIVVNGEGEMIFSTPARDTLLQTLAICALANRLDKPVYYLNGMVSKPPGGPANPGTVAAAAQVLRDARLGVRDLQSQAVAAELLPGIAAPWYPDALFSWSPHFEATATAPYDASRLIAWFDRTGTPLPQAVRSPYIVLSGGSMTARDPERAVGCFTALGNALKALGLPVLLVETCIGDVFLRKVAERTGLELLRVDTPIMAGAAVMANARLFVSGRWHPGIMAALGGTPCVFMGSNSHKTFSLQQMLDYPVPVEYDAFPGAEDIAGIMADARARLAEGMDRRSAIAARAAELGRLAGRLPDLLSGERLSAAPLGAAR